MERAELMKLVLETGCAIEHEGTVFLGDPQSSVAERDQIFPLIAKQGMSILGGLGWLCIPTGGTSGGVRFARHDEFTLGAAVRGFCGHFGVTQVNTLDVLPAYHVSGLMARVRSSATGGERRGWSWKQLEAGEWPELPHKGDGWFLSLVPTQLQRLLANAQSVARLRAFRAVFIGGGPLWPELAAAAGAARVPVAVCYGMTETAAMVVAQRSGDFLNGDHSCGLPMPHACIELVDEISGEIASPGETGLIRIRGENIFRGYWPAAHSEQSLLTEDLGRFDAAGRLTILGRRDAMIITGGKKVHPAEVEEALRASREFDDLAVIGMPDAEWGSAVVVCFPARAQPLDAEKIERALAGLASYKRPKRFVPVLPWPRNAQGKLNRAALAEAASTQPA